MGKILEAFFNDQLHIDDVTWERTPKHQRICERACQLQDQLSEKLDAEDKKLLDELVDAIFDEGCVDAEKKFERGYRLGVLMTMEVFSGQDSFLGNEK